MHVRVLDWAAIEQFGGPEASDQLIPLPLGNGSLITTPVAVVVPAALFEAVIVKPIGVPALAVAASASFVRLSAGCAMTALEKTRYAM